jgi:hypothetical protein
MKFGKPRVPKFVLYSTSLNPRIDSQSFFKALTVSEAFVKIGTLNTFVGWVTN